MNKLSMPAARDGPLKPTIFEFLLIISRDLDAAKLRVTCATTGNINGAASRRVTTSFLIRIN